MDGRSTQQLKKLVENGTGVSQRKMARKFGVGESTISRNLKQLAIKCCKCGAAPESNPGQQKRQHEDIFSG